MPLWAHVDRWVAFAGAALVRRRGSLFRSTATAAAACAAGCCRVLAVSRGDRHTRSNSAISSRATPASRSSTFWSASSSSRRAARATAALLVCLALFLALTQFFYAQTIWPPPPRLPALLAIGVALGGRCGLRRVRPSRGDRICARRRLMPAGHADRGAAVRSVSAPRRTVVGNARSTAARGPDFRAHGARLDQRACRSPTRSRFASNSPAGAAASADATGAVRCSSRFDGAEWTPAAESAPAVSTLPSRRRDPSTTR